MSTVLENINIHDVLFLDIETVPGVNGYNKLSPQMKELWNHKAGFLKKSEEETPELLYNRAGIYAEFGKIICIGVGFFNSNAKKKKEFRLTAFYGDDEKQLLQDFAALLNKHFNGTEHLLCAHNGKEFDFPFLARRMLVNKIKIPFVLDVGGKKPWENSLLDTMQLWRFGDYKQYTSLTLLAALFNIPTPKDDMQGSDVHRVYWQENNLPRIATYCCKDTLTVAQLYLSYRGEDLLKDKEIVLVL